MVSEAHASRPGDQLDKRRQAARPWFEPGATHPLGPRHERGAVRREIVPSG